MYYRSKPQQNATRADAPAGDSALTPPKKRAKYRLRHDGTDPPRAGAAACRTH